MVVKKGRSSSIPHSPASTTGGAASPRRYESSSFWDRWYSQQKDGAALEWSGHINDEVFKKIVSVLDEIPQGPNRERLRVCELGCGCSNLAPKLKEYGVDVVGVDFSQEVINANQQRLPEIEWECWDALKMTEKFESGYFDCIIGKTLIDCFLARSDAAGSIRKLFQQSREVLTEQGRMILLDKASADTIIGRGKTEQIMVEAFKSMTLRTLNAIPRPSEDTSEGDAKQRQMEVSIPPQLYKHFVVRPAAAGSGLLVVWSTDEVATSNGIETGDLIVGFNRHDGKGMQIGSSVETARAIRTGTKMKLLLERPAAGTTQRKTANLKTRLLSRQSTSQSDHLRRLMNARLARQAESSGIARGTSLPKLKVKPDFHISEHLCAAEGYFN
eukprot:TRINITY_DN92210_c0_g1_i1.p1 TRINITY_DN92210_c0_g1~~TRINITY_DN92210_c0_g1_i1.p1  ORF type:complete len:393 (-),score=92.11 TRINITY_DN92210_c0_g1_i1:106-1263(-)